MGGKIKARIEKYSIPEPMSGCLLWLGALSNGYPCLRFDGRAHRVTRLMLSEKMGRPLATEEHALHSCDVPICINPDHLHVGSHAENMRECWTRKPPKRRGDGVGKAKLTTQQVLEIRASTESLRKLGRRFGVAGSTIYFARSGITWSGVTDGSGR